MEMTGPSVLKVVVFLPTKMSYLLSVFTGPNHQVTVNFMCGQSKSVRLAYV